MLVTKTLATGRNKLALQFWTGVSALALSLAVLTLLGHLYGIGFATALFAPQAQDDLWIYLGMGALAVLSHQMIVHALARADASTGGATAIPGNRFCDALRLVDLLGLSRTR